MPVKRLSTALFSLVLAFFLFGMTACKKEKHNTPGNDNLARLSKIVNGEDVLELKYNPGGTPSHVVTTLLSPGGNAVEYAILYRPDKQVLELRGNDGTIITPVYDQGLLLRAHFTVNGDQAGYVAYAIENDQVKEATYYSQHQLNSIPVFNYRFTYDANDNIVETVLMGANGVPNQLVRQGHVTYRYDQKENPLYKHRHLLLLLLQAVSKNNIVLEEHYDRRLVIEDRSRYTYTYKANGLPQKARLRKGLTDATATESDIVYTYQ